MYVSIQRKYAVYVYLYEHVNKKVFKKKEIVMVNALLQAGRAVRVLRARSVPSL